MIERQDDLLARALDDCCQRVRMGETLDDCLNDYPTEYHGELRKLAPVIDRLRFLASDPSTAFQSRLEIYLLAEVDRALSARRMGVMGRLGSLFESTPVWRLGTILLIAVLILVGGGVGVVNAADGSLPDSPLYHVKMAQESAQVIFTWDAEGRLGLFARQMAKRGGELEQAVSSQKRRPVVALLAIRLGFTAERIVDQALELDARGNPAALRRALVAIRAMRLNTERVAAEAAPDAQPPLLRLVTFLGDQENRLAARLPTIPGSR